MASYTILPAAPSGGREIGAALGQGISSYVNATQERRRKEEKEKESEEKHSAYEQAAESSGLELSGLSYDEDGKGTYTYKAKPSAKTDVMKNPAQTIKQAILGMGDIEGVGRALDIPEPTPMNEELAQKIFPVGSMIGDVPSANFGPMDYGQHVQKALQDQYAPGIDRDTIARDFLGLPQPKAPTVKKDVPPEFTTDVMGLKKIAMESGEQSTDVFMAGLEKLSMKYINDPQVLSRIKLIMQALNQ